MSKRQLRIEKVPASTLVRVAWEGGGELPKVLKSEYTSPTAAQNAINAWMASENREVEMVELYKKDEENKKQK